MTSDRLMIYRYIYFGKPLEIIGTLHYRTDGRLILPPRMCKQEITYLKGLWLTHWWVNVVVHWFFILCQLISTRGTHLVKSLKHFVCVWSGFTWILFEQFLCCIRDCVIPILKIIIASFLTHRYFNFTATVESVILPSTILLGIFLSSFFSLRLKCTALVFLSVKCAFTKSQIETDVMNKFSVWETVFLGMECVHVCRLIQLRDQTWHKVSKK